MKNGMIVKQGTYDELMTLKDSQLSELVKIFNKDKKEEIKEEAKLPWKKSMLSDSSVSFVEPKDLFQNENDELINVPWKCYWHLFSMSYGYIFLALSLPFYAGYMYAGIVSNYLIAEWMGAWDGYSYAFYFIFYSLCVAFGITIAYLFIMHMILWVSWNLHALMVSKVLNAPINLYFDVTPSG